MFHAQPGPDKLSESRTRANSSRPHLEENSELMIDLQTPKAKQVGVLASQARGETRGRGDLEVVQHDDRAGRRIMQRQEKSMFALGGIRRAIDENQPGSHEVLERFSL